MDKNIAENRNKVIEFFKDHKKISLFYHIDCDGITSATLAISALKKYGFSDIESQPINYEDFDKIQTRDRSFVFLDINLPKQIYSNLANYGLCMIDHHALVEDSSKFVYVNPKMWGDYTYTPASLITYLLFEPDIEVLDWIAAIGVISDAGGKSQLSFIRKTAEKYGIQLKDNDPFLMKNKFGEAADMINSLTIEYDKEGSEKALAILLNTKTLNELLENKELRGTFERVNERIEKIIEKFDKNSEVRGNIFFFDMPEEYSKYSSTIATKLGLDPEYSGRIIVIGKDIDEERKRLSIRANGVDVDLNDIIKKIVSEIGGEGGGHDKAVGALIYKEREGTFRNMLYDFIQNRLS